MSNKIGTIGRFIDLTKKIKKQKAELKENYDIDKDIQCLEDQNARLLLVVDFMEGLIFGSLFTWITILIVSNI